MNARRTALRVVATTALAALVATMAPGAHAEDGGGPPPSSDIAQPPTDAAQDPAADDPANRQVLSALDLMRGSGVAGDLRGFRESLYTGKWFMPGKEDTRRCILERESHANYRASGGAYFGAYQMSEALGDGATWMMQREVRRELGQAGVDIVQQLRKTTPNNWNRYWQDRAFWTIWRNGEGRHHWGSGISDC